MTEHPLPGLVGGRYEALRRLDQGGSSFVYLARDTRLGRLVALKVLKPEHRGDATLVARLEQEARLAARLNHANLVTLYDWQSDDSGQFAVLEYVPGENLQAYLQRRGRLPADEAVAIARQVLAALAVIHRAGIIHRDVKPRNILLSFPEAEIDSGAASEFGAETDSGAESYALEPNDVSAALAEPPTVQRSNPIAKLTDLGIARSPRDPGHTPIGQTVGTPHYLSPEQAMGRPVSPASDLYSVGAVLYELLVGRPPFDGESAVAVLHQHAYAPPTPPSEVVAGISPELERIVLRALAKDPASRFASAADFSAALDGLSQMAGRPTVSLSTLPAEPPAPTEAARSPFTSQRRFLYTFVSAGLVLLIALFGLYGWVGFFSTGGSPTPRATTFPTTLPASATPPAASSALDTTPTPRPAALASPPPSATPSVTASATATQTTTPTPTATATPTSFPPTATPTLTPTPIPTPTETVVQLTVYPLGTASHSLGALRGDSGRVTLLVTVQGGFDDVRMTVYRDGAIVRNEQTVEREARIDIPLAAPGEYRILLDNRFSLFTSKQVTLRYRLLERR